MTTTQTATIINVEDSEPIRAALTRILRQAEMIARGSHEGLPEERDRQRVAHQF